MPESLAAEAAVLGSMILDPSCIGDVLAIVNAESFYHDEHTVIFRAIVGLWEAHKEGGVDGALVRNALDEQGKLEAIGGGEYLRRVLESVPTAANAVYYAKIVSDKALLRELVSAGTQIVNAAYDKVGETPEKVDEAEKLIFAITDRHVTSEAVALPSLLQDVYAAVEKRAERELTGLPTGYYELDKLTAGFQDGDMIVIAGRPSMGKSSWALNMAEHMALFNDVPVAIFSLEMGRRQLAERFICSNAGVDSQKVRRGNVTTGDYQELVQACNRLADAPIYIDDESGLTPLGLRAKARRLKSKYGIQCIIIDYLQLMDCPGKKQDNRQQEITTISRRIKGLARELNVPVIVLSQLNRQPEAREGHRPRMSDIRESGSVENDADLILLLHREDYYHRGEPDYVPDNIAEAIIGKARNGPTGIVKLCFREQCTRFENLAQAGVPF